MVPKRTLVIAVVAAASLLVAGLALAAFLSSKTTHTSTFTAASIGDVAIGDAETVALFNLSDMRPGDVSSACFMATVDNLGESTPGDWRLYAGSVLGTGLEDYLLITTERSAVGVGSSSAGIFTCTSFHPDTVMVADQQLSLYAATYNEYGHGQSLGTQTALSENWVQVKITIELPDTPTVQTNAAGLTASANWVVENQ